MAYAGLAHYAAHLAPIWLALPPEVRGTFTVPYQLADTAAAEGLGDVRVEYGTVGPPRGSQVCLVASYADHRTAVAGGHPTVYVEHGAGQDYPGDPASARMSGYPGGRGHEGTVLFVSPSERVAGLWRTHYPGVPAVAVGCPRLDGWHRQPRRPRARRLAGATVCLSTHADLPLVPETRSAWRHFAPGLPAAVRELQAAGAVVLGHGHPRIVDRLEADWHRMGVEVVRDVDEVLARADVYVIDNSSSAVEAASLGIPLVWMSPPWYRRDVRHGQRFWEWTEHQAHAVEAVQIPGLVEAALADPPEWREGREAMVASVYVACDGHAAERAAAAILAVVGG